MKTGKLIKSIFNNGLYEITFTRQDYSNNLPAIAYIKCHVNMRNLIKNNIYSNLWHDLFRREIQGLNENR